MAFDLKSYLDNNFKVENNADSLRESANAIISGTDFWGTVGQRAPENWARYALSALDAGDTQGAYDWLSGSKNSRQASRVQQKYRSSRADLQKRLGLVNENYANTTDFSNPNLTDAQKAAAQAQGDRYRSDNQGWFDQANTLGVSSPQMKRTAAGFTTDMNAGRGSRRGRLGEAVRSIQNPDGTWSVIGSNTGKVFQGGLQNVQEAEKWANMNQSGGTANATLAGVAGAPVGGTTSTGQAVGDKVANTTQLNSLSQLGLTEDDIIRDGSTIYLKPGVTEATLKARSASGVSFNASTPQAGSGISADAMASGNGTVDLSQLEDFFSADTSNPIAFVKSLQTLYDAFESERQKMLTGKMDEQTATLEGLRTEVGNRPQTFEDLLTRYGVEDKMKALQDINLQIAQKVGDYMNWENNIQDQTIPTGLLIGQDASLQRQKAADIGALTAVAAAYTDNINLARSLVDQTLEIEFGAQQAQIDITDQLIGVYGDELSIEEGKQAEKVGIVLEERQRILDESREDKKAIYELMLEVAQSGGNVGVIDTSKGLAENIKAAAPYLRIAVKGSSGGGGGSRSSGLTDNALLSAAQKLVESGQAQTLEEAIEMVRNSFGGGSGTTSGSQTTTDNGYADFITALSEEMSMSVDPNSSFAKDMFQEYLASQETAGTTDTYLFSLLSESDKKNMIGQGLDPTNIEDVRKYLSMYGQDETDDNPFE